MRPPGSRSERARRDRKARCAAARRRPRSTSRAEASQRTTEAADLAYGSSSRPRSLRAGSRASTPAMPCGSMASSRCSRTRTGRAWRALTALTRTTLRSTVRRSDLSTTIESCSANSRRVGGRRRVRDRAIRHLVGPRRLTTKNRTSPTCIVSVIKCDCWCAPVPFMRLRAPSAPIRSACTGPLT